jgi:hypothetical protein
MSKRNSLIIVTSCLLTIVAIWLFLPVGVPKTDVARYERWKQTDHLCGRAIWWERRLPQSFARQFHLSALDRKYMDEHERLGDAMVASGYLTNVTIVVASVPTNWVQRAQIAAQFRRAFPGHDGWEFGVYGHSNAIVVTCRPQYEVLSRRALQE